MVECDQIGQYRARYCTWHDAKSGVRVMAGELRTESDRWHVEWKIEEIEHNKSTQYEWASLIGDDKTFVINGDG